MLIECPECKNCISDKSEVCIHCGYPLKQENNNICNINGTNYDLTKELELLVKTDFMQGLRNLREIYGLNLADATTLGNIIKSSKQIPLEYNSSHIEEYRAQLKEKEDKSNTVKCPKCHSTQIQIVPRKWSPLTGIFTNKVDRVCVKCKHKF